MGEGRESVPNPTMQLVFAARIQNSPPAFVPARENAIDINYNYAHGCNFNTRHSSLYAAVTLKRAEVIQSVAALAEPDQIIARAWPCATPACSTAGTGPGRRLGWRRTCRSHHPGAECGQRPRSFTSPTPHCARRAALIAQGLCRLGCARRAGLEEQATGPSSGRQK